MAVRDNVAKVLKDLILPELQGLRAGVDRLGARIDAVEAKVDSRLAALEAKFDARLTALEAKFEARFEAMDLRFGSRLAEMEARLDSIDTRLGDFATRFLAIDQHLVDQSRRIDEQRSDLSARIEAQGGRLA